MMQMFSRDYFLHIIGILLLYNNLPIHSQAYDCVNPINLWGYCINIKQCQPLMTLLRVYGNVEGVPEFLRNSSCGYENSMPKVCCPPTSLPESSTASGLLKSLVQYSSASPPTTPVPAVETPNGAPDCGLTDSDDYQDSKVVNGQPAPLGKWPWMVALGYNSSSYDTIPGWGCGGSLISKRHVLTAAHCVYNQSRLYLVRLGDLDLNPAIADEATPVDILIEKADIHPQFDHMNFENDIAVLRLKEDVQFTKNIKPICLPIPDDIFNDDLIGKSPFVAGWGSIFYRGPTSTRLVESQLEVRTQSECKNAFAKRLTVFEKSIPIDHRIICAGYGVTDTCGGDSGGPFVFPVKKVWYVVGVISFGFQCGMTSDPSGLSRVSAFLDFIRPLLK